MKPFPIPVFGESPFPPQEEDEALAIVSPGEMAVFRMPLRRAPATREEEHAAAAVIAEFLARMDAQEIDGAEQPGFDLHGLPPGVIRVLNETLGEGEVSAKLGDRTEVQETAFAGIWRVRIAGPGNRFPIHWKPRPCRAGSANGPGVRPASRFRPPARFDERPALLAEILARAGRYREHGTGHVVNLTLLPMTPEDLAYLDAALGRGRGQPAIAGLWQLPDHRHRARRCVVGAVFQRRRHLDPQPLEIAAIPEVAL
ncbi:hydrogenase-1 operon protein HyaF, partial [Methylomagnum ishizawai]